MHPHLRSLADLVFAETTADALRGADLVFLALPHGAVRRVSPPSCPRPSGWSTWAPITGWSTPPRTEHYYGGTFAEPWMYGLPELPGQRALIAESTRVANTGCHAVAAVLAIAPLIAAGLADPDDVVITSASGTSGAGRTALPHLLGSEVMGDLTGVQGRGAPARAGDQAGQRCPHAHDDAGARADAARHPVHRRLRPLPVATPNRLATSSPTATPTSRSCTCCRPASSRARRPRLGSNSAHLQATVDADSGRIVVTCALDNLGKGAAGQAVQNANLLLGLAETPA